MRLLMLLCLCMGSLLAGGLTSEDNLQALSKFLGANPLEKERTSLNAKFDVVVAVRSKVYDKLYVFVVSKDNSQAYRAQDFLERATPQEKTYIQQRIQEARAYENTPPKIRDMLNNKVPEGDDEGEETDPRDIALLSLKPLEGTDFNIAQIKDYSQAHQGAFYGWGVRTTTYSTWILDKHNTLAIELTNPSGGFKQARQMIRQSMQEMQKANDAYYHRDFNALFDLIPTSQIVTILSQNPQAKDLYVVLPSALDSNMEIFAQSQRIVEDFPQMLKKANLHIILTDDRNTDNNGDIQTFNQQVRCHQNNATKIALFQNYFAIKGTYYVNLDCSSPKEKHPEHKWANWQDAFFGMGACGDRVVDYHPVPFIYEYKRED
ncbi:hypothetical protein [Helicobacter salomonis]|uniref:hypothetical protein n=1 Tax=Helicobacter salomonis TaxID=56878 RepID=UPI001F3A471D|nr:hypothetical protein [Helicobacter salomonis]